MTKDLTENMWPDAKQAWDNDAKAPVLSTTFPDNPIVSDNDSQEKDYVFEDMIEGKPNLLTRVRRLLGV